MPATLSKTQNRQSGNPRHNSLKYNRPWLYDAQTAFVDSSARYCCVEASTKSGKTISCLVWLFEQAMKGESGQHFFWVAPVYAQAGIAFERLKNWLTASTLPTNYWSINYSNQSIVIAGRIIEFKGSDNPDSLYGADSFGTVIDEASRCKEDAWLAIRSTLTATQGAVKIIGNVRGRKNWAYQLARKAESGEPGMAYFKLTAWDAVEGGVLAREEVEDAKRVMIDSVFRELYLAEPSDDGGNPFGIDAIHYCVEQERSTLPAIAYGVDLAKSTDWTWVIGLDKDGRECVSERWQSDWAQTRQRVARLIGDSPCSIDSTGVGDPIVEDLCRECSGVQGFKFTSGSKQQLMEGLASAIQQRQLTYFDPILINELESFEYEYSSRGVRYSAPPGLHDDGVCSLALANHCRRQYANPVQFDSGFSFVSVAG